MNNRQNSNPEDQHRLLTAFILSMVVLGLFYVFVTKPRMDQIRQQQAIASQTQVNNPSSTPLVVDQNKIVSVDVALAQQPRIPIETESVIGSLSLKGGRIDDLRLKGYNKTLDSNEWVRLLSPAGTPKPYFLESGWISDDIRLSIPNSETVWSIGENRSLNTDQPIVLTWDNGKGLTFKRMIRIDDKYLITMEESVINRSNDVVTLYPYSLISRTNRPLTEQEEKAFENRRTAILHTGPIAYLNDDLHEIDFDDVMKDGVIDYNQSVGWAGITDKYWLVSMLPTETSNIRFAHQKIDDMNHIFQTDSRGQSVTIAPNQNSQHVNRFFAGAKRLDILNEYANDLEIKHLDLAIDFGWFYFFTKPFYLFLSFIGGLYQQWGLYASFGLAIMTLTVILRALTYPLANKAFKSMSMMKKLGPKMKTIKEKYGQDRERMQKEIMELYKREKVTPMGGCLPMFLQIPIFFALYKVLYVAIEMRHAPFYGWINDLSSPDPTNLFNGFGLIPIDLPSFLTIGAWPVMYGITLKLTQRMNPVPNDPVQKQVMFLMPIFFSYFFAQFPAGLVIYFVWSNILGGLQQYVIQKRMGMNPSFFRRRKAEEIE